MPTVTIRDVAKSAGVGVGTVSRVINSSPSVSDETRQRVLETIEELDYSPNPMARRLSLGKTLNIAVIVPFFTRPIFIERLRGIENALAQSEYDLVLYNVETSERRDSCLRDVPRRERVDGLLIISLSPMDHEVDRLLRAGVPTVLIDAHHPELHRLTIDDADGGRQATQHLIDLGHEKIAFVGDYLENPFGFIASKERFEGYYQALELAEIPFRPDYFKQGEYGQLAARRLTMELLSLPDPPTAIFATSDTHAIGVLSAAHEMNVPVPEELSVIGYDDIEVADYLHLTTMRQPSFELGVEGVQQLMDLITRPELLSQEITFPTELISRSTTAEPWSS